MSIPKQEYLKLTAAHSKVTRISMRKKVTDESTATSPSQSTALMFTVRILNNTQECCKHYHAGDESNNQCDYYFVSSFFKYGRAVIDDANTKFSRMLG